MEEQISDMTATIIMIIILVVPSLIVASYFIYEYFYYKSEEFLELKKRVDKYIKDCNDLNEHIEELKNTFVDFRQIDYGNAENVDYSNYNYKRKELQKYTNSKYVYNCSLVVCRNAQQQPFKYLCKYFNIKQDESSLNEFEDVLNNFSAVENGKELLKNQKNKILDGIWKEVPWLIKTFRKEKFAEKLGFQKIDFSTLYFPTYIFNYISSGGNSSMHTDITLDIDNLNRFVIYLGELVKFRKSVAGQRALMTSALREKIKKRDKYTCKKCHNSTDKEPNLLLEIDHIKPLSKGGITSEENLQTLCWRCNRTKGSKYEEKNVEVKDDKKKCSECGTVIEENTKFCTKCGNRLDEELEVLE